MVTLLNDYYRLDGRVALGGDTIFDITLLPDYRAYAGHFPDNPVSPGVCNIQMIKECAELLTGKRLLLAYIGKCRFSTVLTPQTTSGLRLRLRITGGNSFIGRTETMKQSTYQAFATLYDDTATYVAFKGEFTDI